MADRSRVAARAKLVQLTIFPRGGARPGAGRKPRGTVALVSHARRPRFTQSSPLHVTWKLVPRLPSLRSSAEHDVVRNALRACRDVAPLRGLWVIEYSLQSNHLHAIVEARNSCALGRGMQGLAVRITRGLNGLWSREGTVLADRYHAHLVRTPREARHALAYVLLNGNRHGVTSGVDPFSSGASFGGWRSGPRPAPRDVVSPARTWLLRIGWRRHGAIDPREVPGRPAGR